MKKMSEDENKESQPVENEEEVQEESVEEEQPAEAAEEEAAKEAPPKERAALTKETPCCPQASTSEPGRKPLTWNPSSTE